MYWYGIEPLVPQEARKAIELLPQVKVPLVRQHLTRRIVAVHEGAGPPNASTTWILDELYRTLRGAEAEVQRDMLLGLREVYRGRRDLAVPAGWRDAYQAVLQKNDSRAVETAQELAVQFGDTQVIWALGKQLAENPGDERQQLRALALLHSRRNSSLVATLKLLTDPRFPSAAVRRDAIRDLAGYEDEKIPEFLLLCYPLYGAADRADTIQTLTARPKWALALLDAIDRGVIARSDVSALVIRQLQSLGNEEVNARLKKIWGDVRPASAEKKERIAALKEQLTPEALKRADLSRGRAIFAKTCANCHKLFDEGSKLGPELTGSQRHNLDYVLDNVLDPSAIVPRDYKVNVLRLTDGRVVQGVILAETPHTLTVQTANETIPVAVTDIEARKESPLSMMPEGLLDRLHQDDIADLVTYLASPQQVPLPPPPTR
jgi:putative heme-binding domain-containing protein